MLSNRPLIHALLFGVFPVTFYLLDFINYSRAGKLLITGMATIGLLSALAEKYRSSLPRWLLFFVSLVLFANLSFHAGMRDIFGVAQDEMMIMKSILSTDGQESYEFWLQYKPYLIKHLLIFVFSFGLFYLLALKPSTKKQHIPISAAILSFWILFFIIGHLEKSIRRGNPFIYFPHFYNEYRQELSELKQLDHLLQSNQTDNALSGVRYYGKDPKNTVVWVIGESSTKHNWSLYGYDRETTPLIDSIRSELLVFDHILAAAPITIPAFERMLTPATKADPERWKKEPSVLQIAKKAGYHTYWISNHTTDAHNGITTLFARQADEVYITNKGKARGEGSYDASVLPAYQKALQDPYDKKLILVHLLGSHPAYNFRYPDSYARFTGNFDDEVAKSLEKRGRAKWAIAFRNFYDNSVLYGDYIRYTLLKKLQKSPDVAHAVWIYHPDHGEDVCHHTNFSGHNKHAIEQWEIPMLVWSPVKMKGNTKRKYRLDEIESTILGLLKISSKYYHSDQDILIRNSATHDTN